MALLVVVAGQMAMLGEKTDGQKRLLESTGARTLVVFAAAYTTMAAAGTSAAAALALSAAAAAAFAVLTRHLLNEHSRFSVLPRRWLDGAATGDSASAEK